MRVVIALKQRPLVFLCQIRISAWPGRYDLKCPLLVVEVHQGPLSIVISENSAQTFIYIKLPVVWRHVVLMYVFNIHWKFQMHVYVMVFAPMAWYATLLGRMFAGVPHVLSCVNFAPFS